MNKTLNTLLIVAAVGVALWMLMRGKGSSNLVTPTAGPSGGTLDNLISGVFGVLTRNTGTNAQKPSVTIQQAAADPIPGYINAGASALSALGGLFKGWGGGSTNASYIPNSTYGVAGVSGASTYSGSAGLLDAGSTFQMSPDIAATV